MSQTLKFLDVSCDHQIRDEALDVNTQTRRATLKTRSTGNGLRLFQGDNEIQNIDEQGNFNERYFLVDDQTIEINDFENVDLEGDLRNAVIVTESITRSVFSNIDSLSTSEDVTILQVGTKENISEFTNGVDFLIDSNRTLSNFEFLTLDLSGTIQKLQHFNVTNVIVTNLAMTSGYVSGYDYSVNQSDGTITWLSSGSIGDVDTILVTYDFPGDGGNPVTESVTFAGADAYQQLAKTHLVDKSLEVRDGTRTILYQPETDYQIDYVTGTFKILTGGKISLAPPPTQIYVTYRYEDLKPSYERVVRSGSHIDFLANTKATELNKVGLTFSQDFATIYKRLAFFPGGDSQKLHYTDFSEISVFGLDQKIRSEEITFNDRDTADSHYLKHSNIYVSLGTPDLQVWSLDRNRQYEKDSDYTIDVNTGVLARIADGGILSDQRVSTDYSYSTSGSVVFTDYGQTTHLANTTFVKFNSLTVMSSGGISGFTEGIDYTIDYATGALTQLVTGSIPLNLPLITRYRAFVIEEEVQFGVDGKTQFLLSHSVLDDFQVENLYGSEDLVDRSDYVMHPLQGKIVSLNPKGNIGANETVVVTYTYPVAQEEEEITFTSLPGGNTVKLIRDLIFEFEAAGYVEGQDYTLNRRNGTISRLAYGKILLNTSVYLTYDYSLVYDLNKDYTYSKSTEFLTRIITGKINEGDIVRIGYTRKDPVKMISEDFAIASESNDYKGDVYITKPSISDTQTVLVTYNASGTSTNPYTQNVSFDTSNLSRRLHFQNVSNVIVQNSDQTITYLEDIDYVIDFKNGVITRVVDGRIRWLTGADQSLKHQRVSSVNITGAVFGSVFEIDNQAGIVSLVAGGTPVQTVSVSYQYDVVGSGMFVAPSGYIVLDANVSGFATVTSSFEAVGYKQGIDYDILIVGTQVVFQRRASNIDPTFKPLPLYTTINFSFRNPESESITFRLGSNIPPLNTAYYVDLLFKSNNAIRWLSDAVRPLKAPASSTEYFVKYSFYPLRVVAIDTSVLVADKLTVYLEQIGDSQEAVGELSPVVGKYYVQGDNTILTGLIGKEKGFLNSRDPVFGVEGLMISFERSNFTYHDNVANIDRYLFSRGNTSTIFTYPHYALDYICQENFCLKCSATDVINDFVKDNLGRYVLIQKSIKLEQDVLKVIRDELGSNPLRPQWGSTVESLIGRSFPDTLVQSLIRETVISALTHLIDLQTQQASLVLPSQSTQFVTTQVLLSDGSTQNQTIEVSNVNYQTLDPAERIQSISSVTVTRNTQEPTEWDVQVIILTGAQKPLVVETGIVT
jgi:hypothetical protein